MTTHDRIPSHAREYLAERQNKTAAQIQADIELMRLRYAERRSLNHPRHEALVGWSLVAVGVIVPVIAAIGILLL